MPKASFIVGLLKSPLFRTSRDLFCFRLSGVAPNIVAKMWPLALSEVTFVPFHTNCLLVASLGTYCSRVPTSGEPTALEFEYGSFLGLLMLYFVTQDLVSLLRSSVRVPAPCAGRSRQMIIACCGAVDDRQAVRFSPQLKFSTFHVTKGNPIL